MTTKLVGFAVAVGLAVGTAAAVWVTRQRRNPSPLSYGQRFFLDLPRPFARVSTLRRLLATTPGQRMLEIGQGTGYYALHIAAWLGPRGRLAVIDVQRQMLEETRRRAVERGIANIVPTLGDAQELPFTEGTFDGVYLTGVLGEIPDKTRALREAHRVLKPGGRLVVGESQPDPHMIAFDTLRERAESVGLRFEETIGGRLGYLALFRAG